MDGDSLDNPLPPCPELPNCARVSVVFDIGPDSLVTLVRAALRSMRPESIRESDHGRLSSVHRAVFFKDDMDILVGPRAGGSVLHVRSASRVGRWDLGVNGRRVRRLLRAVERQIER